MAAVTSVLMASYPTLMATSYNAELLRLATPIITRANQRLLASGTYHVAEEGDGAIIGCGGWTPERPGTAEKQPGVGHVRHFATIPDRAGQGIGRMIYACCETQARAAGVAVIECYASLNAERFYASLGFAVVGLVGIPLGDGVTFPSVLMRRLIPG
jgi:GNAT superfamily N-acetyltransferase